ncbi:hypothetical protein K2M58_09995 [Hydrogenibacillus sp. N12]|nr:hypothetical protein K2M58_09995 [Hydrogenibacillus sp. N12]
MQHHRIAPVDQRRKLKPAPVEMIRFPDEAGGRGFSFDGENEAFDPVLSFETRLPSPAGRPAFQGLKGPGGQLLGFVRTEMMADPASPEIGNEFVQAVLGKTVLRSQVFESFSSSPGIGFRFGRRGSRILTHGAESFESFGQHRVVEISSGFKALFEKMGLPDLNAKGKFEDEGRFGTRHFSESPAGFSRWMILYHSFTTLSLLFPGLKSGACTGGFLSKKIRIDPKISPRKDGERWQAEKRKAKRKWRF